MNIKKSTLAAEETATNTPHCIYIVEKDDEQNLKRKKREKKKRNST